MRVVFHLGFHKTGSSWLQSVYFQDHPEIVLLNNYQQPWNDPFLSYLITTQETHFDVDQCRQAFDLLRENVQSKNNDERLLMVSAERLSGHPYSGGYDRAQILKRLKAAFPSAQVLLVIRNQLDAIASVYKQLVAEGCTASLDALLLEDRWKTCGFSRSYWDYFEYVDLARKIFGSDGVKVLCYEQMRSDMNGFLRKLCDDLKISYFQTEESGKIVNPSLPDRSINLLRRMNHLRQSELNPQPAIKLNIAHRWIYDRIVKIGGSVPANWKMSALPQKDNLTEHFAKNNKLLMQILDHDLAKYGYPL